MHNMKKVFLLLFFPTFIYADYTMNELVDSETDIESLTKLANLMVLLLQSLHGLENMKG